MQICRLFLDLPNKKICPTTYFEQKYHFVAKNSFKLLQLHHYNGKDTKK